MASSLLAGEMPADLFATERTPGDLARRDDEEDAPNSIRRIGFAVGGAVVTPPAANSGAGATFMNTCRVADPAS
jgi:hypothetical protein